MIKNLTKLDEYVTEDMEIMNALMSDFYQDL